MAEIFDTQSTPTEFFDGPINLTMTRVHQQACIDSTTNTLYFTQIIQNGWVLADESEAPPAQARDARGDLCITRVDRQGTITGRMFVRGFDHGAGISAENVGGTVYIWMSYDAPERPIGSNAYGTKICRFPFTVEAILDVGDSGIEVFDPQPNGDHITCSLDLPNQQMGTLAQENGTYTYRVYDLDNFKARDFTAKWRANRQLAQQFQAWTLFGEHIYQLTGYAYNDDDNPPPPEGTGNSYFTVYDMPTGTVVARNKNLHQLNLSYREAESIFLWDTSEGPRLVYGWAVDSPPRKASLWYFSQTRESTATITAVLVTDPRPAVRLNITASEPGGILAWRLTRETGGAETPIANGGPGTLPPSTSIDDTAPVACVTAIYHLYITRAGGTEVADSNGVLYVPPEGCGTPQPGGGAIDGSELVLGCPSRYRAAIHWRGGAQEYAAASLENLVEVSWSRTINDISDAQITVQKGSMNTDCCAALGLVEPWVHELTIYRDSELVWQGPIIKVTERPDEFMIDAQDVFAWLDKLVNTFLIRYVSATADAQGRRRGPVTYIAWNILRLNLEVSSLSIPPDYPQIMDYVVRRDTSAVIKFEKDGSAAEPSPNSDIWAEYVGNIWRELTKRGLTWTTVGRSLFLRGKPTSSSRAVARLSLNDFSGDIELIKDGTVAATYAFATSQQTQDITGGHTVGTGKVGTPYGRLDNLVRLQEEDATDADLREAARDGLAGRYPVPAAISVPTGAQLSPEAPVIMRELVPGERLDVTTENYCTKVSQGFFLSDVEVTWDESGEKVAITLIPLADVDEEL